MPLVPAQAATAQAKPAAMTMAMNGDGHCGEAPSAPDKAVPGSHCGAACALLPPEAQRSIVHFPAGRAPLAEPILATFASRTTLLSTPPPKRG